MIAHKVVGLSKVVTEVSRISSLQMLQVGSERSNLKL